MRKNDVSGTRKNNSKLSFYVSSTNRSKNVTDDPSKVAQIDAFCCCVIP